MQGLLFSLLTMSLACAFIHPKMNYETRAGEHPEGQNLVSRFDPPSGYSRVQNGEMTSFFHALPLHEQGHEVLLYNGQAKLNQKDHAAVFRYDVGTKDLQQCADACIRMRAEFLWQQRNFDAIHFELTNGWRMDYSEWRKGKRLVVRGHTTTWSAAGHADTSYSAFRVYLDHVFMYAGTQSLYRELQRVDAQNIAIGDVIVQAGSPGHAVMVADVAVNAEGNKMIMLAQSYMPAQEIHILRNPADQTVWHPCPKQTTFATAEWLFDNYRIGRF